MAGEGRVLTAQRGKSPGLRSRHFLELEPVRKRGKQLGLKCSHQVATGASQGKSPPVCRAPVVCDWSQPAVLGLHPGSPPQTKILERSVLPFVPFTIFSSPRKARFSKCIHRMCL